MAQAWLFLVSIFFYAYWDVGNLLVLGPSIVANFLMGRGIMACVAAGQGRRARQLMIAGVGVNLIVLAYYKYLGFALETMTGLLHWDGPVAAINLPLGISFFTFTQIAFLIDAARGNVRDANPIHYGLFVVYYPHLIAGPIMHHADVLPQFARPHSRSKRVQDCAVGLALFAIGMFKKVALADQIAPSVPLLFDAAKDGAFLRGSDCWLAALCYSMQIYFDFSGYSDMAVGLSRMMGIRIPMNFFSPYKASSIIDFWRRWHISLSTFLRDYLYLPLGGNRHGKLRRYINLLTVMLLAGLWHGANWTFVVWGAVHGILLILNHAWRWVAQTARWQFAPSRFWTSAGVGATFIACVFAWVPFRAADLQTTWRIWRAMLTFDGFVLPAKLLAALGPVGEWLRQSGLPVGDPFPLMGLHPAATAGALLVIAWACPNSQEIMARFRPSLIPKALSGTGGGFGWKPNWAWTLGLAAAIGYSVFQGVRGEFLYFQF